MATLTSGTMRSQSINARGSSTSRVKAAVPSAGQFPRGNRVFRAAACSRRAPPGFAARSRVVPVYATASLQALGTSLIQKAAKAAKTPLLVAGAEGQLALRFVKELAAAGEKVVAGVADIDRAQAALDFARKYEVLSRDALSNIKLAELDYRDPEALAASLPRRSKVLLVEGDTVAGRPANAGIVTAVLAAAAEADVTPIIITSTPSASGKRSSSGGGGLFSFAGAGRPGQSRAAAAAQKAGVEDYVIIQAAGLDASSEDYSPGNVVVAEAGTVDPATAGAVGILDVSDVLRLLLTAPELPSGPVTLAVAGTSVDVGDAKGQLATALSTIGERNAAEAEAKREKQASAAAPVAPRGGLFGTKQLTVQPVTQQEEEEVEEEQPAKPASSLFGGFGTKRLTLPKPPVQEEEEEEQEAPRPAKSQGLFGFGTKKVQQQREEEEEEEEEQPQPARAKSPLKGLFGLGAKPVYADEQEEEEEEEQPAARRPAPFSLFGAPKRAAATQEREEDEEEEEPGGLFAFGTRRIKARAQQSSRVQEVSPAQKAAETRAAQIEAQRRKQEEAREAQRRKQQEARAAAEARRQQQEEARRATAEAAKRKQEEARAALEAQRRQQEQAKRVAAAEAAKKKQQEEARARAAATAKAKEDQRRKAEEQRRAAAEAAKKRQEEARAKAEAAAKTRAEAAAKAKEEQRRRAEEAKRKQEAARAAAAAKAKQGTGTTSRSGSQLVKAAKAGAQKAAAVARVGPQKAVARGGTQKSRLGTQRSGTQSSSKNSSSSDRGLVSFPTNRRR